MTSTGGDTTKAREAFFETYGATLVRAAHRPLAPWSGPRTLSKQFAFFADAHTLAIVAWPGAKSTVADEALAWGLALGGDRDVILVIPSGMETPTLQRLPWVAAPVRVYCYDAALPSEVYPVVIPAKAEVFEHVCTWGARGARSHAQLKATQRTWISDLLAWLDAHPGLAERHRASYLSWHAAGRQVLRISRTSSSVTIEAGVRYSKPTSDQPGPLDSITLHGPLVPEDLDRVQAAVSEAIQRRSDGLDAGHEEHRLQHALAQAFHDQGQLLGLTQLHREYPAWRPGHRPAYIDFLGTDKQGRPHVVEVKLGNDVMLALQGLDYWIWASANPDVVAGALDSTPGTAPLIDFVVGAHRTSTAVGPYTRRQLEALDGGISWRFHVATGWKSDLHIESFPSRQVPPPPTAWEPTAPPRHAQRLHDHLLANSGLDLKGAGPYVAVAGAGIVPQARDAWRELQSKGLLHKQVDHIRSSQAFALNMLAGLDHPARAAIAALVGVEDAAITDEIVFEFQDDPDRLGEATKASPHRTQVDAAIACTAGTGARTLVLIEVKLSEIDFGHCSAYQAAGNDRRDICTANGPFGNDPDGCFQLRNHGHGHRRTYDLHLGPTPPTGNGCSFRLGTNQPMRNVALGRALLDAGEADQVIHALLAPSTHTAIWRRWSEAKAALHGVPGVKMSDLPAEAVLKVHDPDRRRRLADRYDLGS